MDTATLKRNERLKSSLKILAILSIIAYFISLFMDELSLLFFRMGVSLDYYLYHELETSYGILLPIFASALLIVFINKGDKQKHVLHYVLIIDIFAVYSLSVNSYSAQGLELLNIFNNVLCIAAFIYSITFIAHMQRITDSKVFYIIFAIVNSLALIVSLILYTVVYFKFSPGLKANFSPQEIFIFIYYTLAQIRQIFVHIGSALFVAAVTGFGFVRQPILQSDICTETSNKEADNDACPQDREEAAHE